MKYQSYPKYKPSGVAWLGEVPDGWQVTRLKNLIQEPLMYGANEAAEGDDPSQPRFIRITDIDTEGNLREDTYKSLPLEIAKPYLLKEGDVLLARSGATVGKSFIYSERFGSACFAGYLIRARLNPFLYSCRFFSYCCQTDFYWQYVSGTQIKATIQNVSAEKYANLALPTPCVREQSIIATFLDRETAKIDTLIAKQEKLIELLKEKRQAVISHAVTKGLDPTVPMKPSGVEWLGDVPEHWDVMSMKRVAAIRYGIGEPPKYQLEGIRLIRATNVHAGKLFEKDMVFVDPKDIPESRIVWLMAGDIIVVRSGAYTGDSAIIPNEYDSCIAGFDMVLRCHSVSPNFVQYALLSKYLKEGQLDLEKMRAAQPHLNAEELGSCLVAVPSILEQEKIVTYLNVATAKIDTLITKAQQAIILQKEHRTALISAAVTGKIDVRGEVDARQAA